MNIYLVRNKDGKYFNRLGKFISWGAMQDATVYNYRPRAYEGGLFAFQWGDNAEEKFEVVHLFATVQVDKSDYPKTLDGVAIELGKTYYRPYNGSIDEIYAAEVCVQMDRDGNIKNLRIREDCRAWKNALWVYANELYGIRRFALAARKEEQCKN